MNKGNILVTPRSLSKNGHPFLQRLEDAGFSVLTPFPGKQPTEQDLLNVLPDCIAYLAGVEKVSAEVLQKCSKLKVISRNGVGIDNVDKKAAESKKIKLKVARGANSRGVAELAITFMLSMIRSITATNNSIKANGWDRNKGFEVYGKTLGVIGTGQIGMKTAKMAAGLDMKILAYDLYPDKSLEKLIPGFLYTNVEEVLKNSDIVTLHCPAGEMPLMNSTTISQMKFNSYLINTARASLVDQDALLKALNTGHIAGYAVDAFETEPPQLTDLLRHKNVLLSSHIGGFTKESVDRATEIAIKNILDEL